MATQNIFNSNQVWKGSFHVGNSQISFGAASADHLAQNIQYQYAQQVQMIYELGAVQTGGIDLAEQSVYYAGGRASGTASLARIVTSRPVANDALLTTYNNICKPEDIAITQLTAECFKKAGKQATVSTDDGVPVLTPNIGSTTRLHSAILQSLNGSMETQSALFTQQMSFMFLNMTVTDGTRGPVK